MSLTSAIAMTRENACTERSTESNQPHRPIVSSPPNASAEFESSTRSGGALCWERANGESETPVVSLTSFGCPGPAIVTTTSKVAKSISQYSVSTSVLAGAQSPDAGSRSEEIQVSFHACFACFRAILTRFPHIAFSATFFIVLPPPALCSHTPYSRMSPLYVFFPLSPCAMSLSLASRLRAQFSHIYPLPTFSPAFQLFFLSLPHLQQDVNVCAGCCCTLG